MIRHVLMFKFNDGVPEHIRNVAFRKLEELGDRCSTVANWVVARNAAVSPSAYDMIEIADFMTQTDLEDYKMHPAHIEFAEHIGTVATWALVDFELTS